MTGEFPSRPGQVRSVQFSQAVIMPLPDTAVAHHGDFPSMVVHRSLCLALSMKGKTQLPQVEPSELPEPTYNDRIKRKKSWKGRRIGGYEEHQSI